MLKILCENLFNNKILDKVKNFSKFKLMLVSLTPNIYHLTPASLAQVLHRQTDRQTDRTKSSKQLFLLNSLPSMVERPDPWRGEAR